MDHRQTGACCACSRCGTFLFAPLLVIVLWPQRGVSIRPYFGLQNFCVAISVSPHVCFILVLILISMFLR